MEQQAETPTRKKRGHPKGEPVSSAMELRAFTHDAYRCLGENYLIREWLPAKGPYFVALIQAMRAHVYWNFANGDQQTTFVPEAATIAKWAGMSRSKVFDLLADPDMRKFIVRVNRRRYAGDDHREVQTSNLYYVVLEDAPANDFDRAKVERSQRRIDAIEAVKTGKMSARDAGPILAELDALDAAAEAEKAARTPGRKPFSSESTKTTLKGVVVNDSQRCPPGRHEDRMTINYSDDGIRRSARGDETSGVAASAIGNAGETGRGRGTTNQDEARNSGEGQHTPKSRSLEPHKSAGGAAGVAGAAVLSEGETWKAQARAALDTTRHPVTKQNDLEHQLAEFGTEGIDNAVERVLSHHARYLTPVELIPDLAQIARTRTANRDAHIYESAAGYFITTLCNLATEARRAGYDLAKLRKTTAKATAKQRPQAQAAHAPAIRPSAHAQPVTRSPITGGGVAADDVLRMSRYGR